MDTLSMRKHKTQEEQTEEELEQEREREGGGGLLEWKTRVRALRGILVLGVIVVLSMLCLMLGDDTSFVAVRMSLWSSIKDQSFRLPPAEQSFNPQHADAEILEGTSDVDPRNTTVPPAASVKEKESSSFEWVEFPWAENETEVLMGALRRNGSEECHRVGTKTGLIMGLPELKQGQQRIQLEAGPVHELQIVSMGEDGRARCHGGDYYETDLSGPTWKSRPPIMDHQNGTYTMRLQVDPRFAGKYELTVILLFSHLHGLRHHVRNARLQQVANISLEFVLPEKQKLEMAGLELPKCERKDFVERKYWSGRWTREQATPDCAYGRYGRWICVNETLECQQPWCQGRVGKLESNGWVYSAHCAFKLFEPDEAWQCLDGKWLFFWGDSNHIDTIRNLLNFVLGFNQTVKFLDRRMDTVFYAPGSNNSTSVRITSLFNGHSNVSMNYEGLYSLHNREFADQCRSFFTGEKAPDFMVMNSGLHDGIFWKDMETFMTEGVDFSVEFWTSVWDAMKARRPDLLYRTTVTTGGSARNQSFNPQKMEFMNHLILDKLTRLKLERFQIVDGFDYTYPWHYDHKTNDGVHYGRPPTRSKWAGGNMGHRYFVDLMLVHMLLNAIC